MKLFIPALLMLVSWFLSACAPTSTSVSGGTPRAEDWSPEKVRLSCPSGDCPVGVGLFVLTGETEEHLPTITRCSATLVGPDQILTNAHCVEDDAKAKYFFTRDDQGQTVYRRVEAQIFSVRTVSFEIADRDLALWKLSDPLTQVQPRTIARAVPATFDRLVGYVMDLDRTGEWETHFHLTKRECNLRPHVALIDGGVADQSSRLALFGCEIRLGNSGAPLFTPGHLDEVQAVVHSIVNDNLQMPNYTDSYRSFFTPQAPGYLGAFFAVAERVHCTSIPGFKDPEHACAKPRSFQQSLKPAVEQLLADRYRVEQVSGGIRWGERALSTRAVLNRDQAVSLMPVPICFEGHVSVDGPQTLAMATYRIGLDSENQPHVDYLNAREYNYRAQLVGAKVQVETLSQFKQYAFFDREAPELNQTVTEISPCETGSVTEDLAKARLAFAGAQYPPVTPEDTDVFEF